MVRSIVTDAQRKVQVNAIKITSAAVLLASVVGLQPTPALAQNRDRDRYEDQRDRYDDRRDRREDRYDRREDRWDRRDDRYARRDYRYDPRYVGAWDPVHYYRRDDRRYGPRRMTRTDYIYRGSDNRYYCRRDDGTAGLIVGGISGGALGNVIAPRGSKILGTILGASAGALIGRAIDDGDVVCR